MKNPIDVSARLVKLLRLTTSSSDNESLAAIRKVNSILKTHNVSWEELINNACFKPWLQMSDETCMRKVQIFLRASQMSTQYLYLNGVLEALAFHKQTRTFRECDKKIIYEAYEKIILH